MRPLASFSGFGGGWASLPRTGTVNSSLCSHGWDHGAGLTGVSRAAHGIAALSFPIRRPCRPLLAWSIRLDFEALCAGDDTGWCLNRDRAVEGARRHDRAQLCVGEHFEAARYARSEGDGRCRVETAS